MIKVLVVDDHTLFRQGIVNLLEQVDDISVVGQAGSSAEAISLARTRAPRWPASWRLRIKIPRTRRS
jgi:two-component system nitrate/nitrite response regulator NarL